MSSSRVKIALAIIGSTFLGITGLTCVTALVSDNIPTKPVERTVEETTTIKIDYSTKRVDDPSLPKGETKTVQVGVPGEKVLYYTVTYRDDTEINRVFERSEIVRQPVDEIISVGTYVAPAPQPSCPNGSYVNTYGNTVCRPSTTNAGGATAICNDGTYSYSQSRRGTCSYHGGVRAWL